jgi:hypothetical protein
VLGHESTAIEDASRDEFDVNLVCQVRVASGTRRCVSVVTLLIDVLTSMRSRQHRGRMCKKGCARDEGAAKKFFNSVAP